MKVRLVVGNFLIWNFERKNIFMKKWEIKELDTVEVQFQSTRYSRFYAIKFYVKKFFILVKNRMLSSVFTFPKCQNWSTLKRKCTFDMNKSFEVKPFRWLWYNNHDKFCTLFIKGRFINMWDKKLSVWSMLFWSMFLDVFVVMYDEWYGACHINYNLF